jgi:hypothetical protein
MKDSSAAVRLRAVKAALSLAAADSATAVAALMRDPDRGVRLAAISATASLGGPSFLKTVLERCEPTNEADAAVRQAAWATALDLLPKVPIETMADLADRLTKGLPETGENLVKVLRLWAQRLPADKPEQWVPVRLRLGDVLTAAGRPGEAGEEFRVAYESLAAASDARASAVYLKYIDALLASDDSTAVARIAESNGDKPAAIGAMLKRMEALKTKKDWDALARLGGEAATKLASQLSAPQTQAVAALLEEARKQQAAADPERVKALLARLGGADEADRAAAGKELLAMKARAVTPLCAELKNMLAADKPDPGMEKSILDLLGSLAPQLKGYDLKAAMPDRTKCVDGWIKQLGA